MSGFLFPSSSIWLFVVFFKALLEMAMPTGRQTKADSVASDVMLQCECPCGPYPMMQLSTTSCIQKKQQKTAEPPPPVSFCDLLRFTLFHSVSPLFHYSSPSHRAPPPIFCILPTYTDHPPSASLLLPPLWLSRQRGTMAQHYSCGYSQALVQRDSQSDNRHSFHQSLKRPAFK